MENILWLNDIKKQDISIVGGKAANLGDLESYNFKVPPGFVLSSKAYLDYVRKTGVQPHINKVLANINMENPVSLQEASTRIQQIILSMPMPLGIAEDIRSAYMILCKQQNNQVYVAVRSSIVVYDNPELTFPGQQHFLDVLGDNDVIKAVRQCWASLYTPKAIFYRGEKGLSNENVGIAIIIQEMVKADVSGVMFTADTTGDKNKMIIEAAYGLGPGVVSGLVNPDNYVIDKESLKVLNRKISKQETRITRNLKGRGTVQSPVPEPMQRLQKIPENKLRELSELGKKVEEHYYTAQNIEWALHDDTIYITDIMPMKLLEKAQATIKDSTAEIIAKGLAASPGVSTGPVRLILSLEDLNKIQKGEILVIKTTSPDMVPYMKRTAGIITDEGGATAHAAVLSRELGIPCVVGTRNSTEILKEGEIVTIDGSTGTVYKGKLEIEQAASSQEIPAAGAIQTKTKIYVNLSTPDRAKEIAKLPVDGVGLMRSEFLISNYIKEHPLKMLKEGRGDEYIDKFASGVEKVAESFAPRPVIVRFSDFKSNEYMKLSGGEEFEHSEENPMLGWRGASRYYHPNFIEAFKLEVRAIKKVREKFNNVHVMIPFVRTVEEVKRVLDIMQREGLTRSPTFKIWLMAEVPSVALLTEEFAEYCDGFSIGSNDLTQLILGVDRDSELLAKMDLFNPDDEAVKKAIRMIIDGAHKKGKTVSLCGQAPSDSPAFAEFLVHSGIDSISVNADAIIKTRSVVAEAEGNRYGTKCRNCGSLIAENSDICPACNKKKLAQSLTALPDHEPTVIVQESEIAQMKIEEIHEMNVQKVAETELPHNLHKEALDIAEKPKIGGEPLKEKKFEITLNPPEKTEQGGSIEIIGEELIDPKAAQEKPEEKKFEPKDKKKKFKFFGLEF